MFANRVLLLSAAVLVWGCGGKKDRAEAAASRAATPAPVRTSSAPTSTTKRAAPTSTAAKPGATTTKPVAKSSNKSAGSSMALKVPEAHLPPAGQCRIWKDGTTIFNQPQARSCDGIVKIAPAASMVLERPSKDTKIVRVRYIDSSRSGHVVRVRVFEAATGKYLRDEKV